MGLSEEDFEELFQFLMPHYGYTGVFAKGWPSLWRHRLENWSFDNFSKALTSVSAQEMSDKLYELGMGRFAPAKSRWAENIDAVFAFACSSCFHPTELEYSVSAFDPAVPVYAERKRICFECVLDEEYSDHGLEIDPFDNEIAEGITSGRIQRP